MDERLSRVRHLLEEIHNVAIATADADGNPHNSPVFTAFDARLQAFWCSHEDSIHSRNISANGKAFLVLFDSREGHGGLYMETTARALTKAAEIDHGMGVIAKLRARLGRPALDSDSFTALDPQRIYQSTPVRLWVNVSDRDSQGRVIQDRRHEIKLSDLLAS